MNSERVAVPWNEGLERVVMRMSLGARDDDCLVKESSEADEEQEEKNEEEDELLLLLDNEDSLGVMNILFCRRKAL